MIRSFIPLLFCAIIGAASFTEVLARDNLPIGYTAVTGIKADFGWLKKAGSFEKYNIQPHLILIMSGSKMGSGDAWWRSPVGGGRGQCGR